MAQTGNGLLDVYREHVENNPLRKWRHAHGASFNETAALVGISVSTIQKWETGAAYPTDTNLVILQRITGMDDIVDEWTNWYNSIPVPRKGR